MDVLAQRLSIVTLEHELLTTQYAKDKLLSKALLAGGLKLFSVGVLKFCRVLQSVAEWNTKYLIRSIQMTN